MKVKILYFASVREKLGKDAEELDLPAGIATVAALRSTCEAGAALMRILFPKKFFFYRAAGESRFELRYVPHFCQALFIEDPGPG